MNGRFDAGPGPATAGSGDGESGWRTAWELIRTAPRRAKLKLAINVMAVLFALTIAGFDNLHAGGRDDLFRQIGLLFGLSGISALTLVYLLHQLSQGSAVACTDKSSLFNMSSFLKPQYRALHRILVALPVLAAAAAISLAIGIGMFVPSIVEKPLLLIVVAMFSFYLVLAVRTVSRTGRFLYGQAEEQAEAAARARAEAAEAQLAALQAQLNPHFLFNALNTVASLVRTDGSAAEAAVENLAEVLRRTLARSRQARTTLREELDYLRAYLAIEQERFGERLSVVWSIEPETLELTLPPMTLQPLVENALRHGLGARLEGGRIEIAAARENGRLALSVSDDGVGFPSRYREGTGLSNLRERMRTLYSDASDLSVESNGRGARVVVKLPAVEPGVESP